MKFTKKLLTLITCLIVLTSCDLLDDTTNDPTSPSDTTSSTLTDTTSVPDSEPYWVHFETYCTETLDSVFTNYISQMPIVNNPPLHLTGWYLEATYVNLVSFPYLVTSEITLHAKWDAVNMSDFAFELTANNEGYKVVSYGGNTNNLIIPNEYNNKPVLEIGDYVFANNGVIQYLILPIHLVKIHLAAFKNCLQLTNLTLPSSLTHLDTDAFSGCANLRTIILSFNLKVIGNNAFEGSNVTSITLNNKVEEIRSRAFGSCSSLNEVILHPLAPPLRFNNSFEGTRSTLVYKVPSSVLNVYKQNEYWSAFQDQIVAQ